MKFRFHLTKSQLLGVGLVVCLLTAAVCYFWATAIMDSLYAYRSPIKSSPPQPGAVLGQPATRKLVYVLIDGLRLDVSLKAEVMPNLARLRQQGASASMHSQAPSFSQPGYSTLLTGGWPYLNDGPAANLDYADIPTWTQDNLFSAAKRAGLQTAVSGYNWFEKLIPQSAVTASFYTPGEDQTADREVVDAALPWLSQSEALVLIHIDQVDYAGHHEGGPLSTAGLAAAKRADDLLGEILAKMDLSQNTILVTSDHGHIDAGGHGGIEPVVLLEPFVLSGAGVKPGEFGDVQMVDVAPTLTALLGTNLPASSQGQPRTAMLDLPAATQSALPQALQDQQAALVTAITAAISQPVEDDALPKFAPAASYQQFITNSISRRLYLERIPRWVTLGFLLLLAFGLFSRVNPRLLAWTFGGAFISVALFHLRYAVLDGHAYSISWVAGEMDLILYIGITTAIAVVIGWLVTMAGMRAFTRNRSNALPVTLSYLLAAFALLALPIGVGYAVNGLSTTWILPDFLSYFLTLLTLIEALASAVMGLLLIGLSSLWSRR
jgi:hypothetical protein